MAKPLNILFYGYGNPGRQDDGLGVAFVNRIEEWVEDKGLQGFEFENNYQLNIEDAEVISDKDIVIFVDASVEDISDFCLTIVDGKRDVTFTTHAASPGYVFQLCQDLFNRTPATYLLHIKGYEWEFDEGLGEAAEKNLAAAVEYIKGLLAESEIFLEKDLTKLRGC